MPESAEPKSAPKWEWYFAAVVSVAVLWLHFHFWANAGGLWRDEVNTVNLARNGSFEAMTHDSFPILMPLLIKLWSQLNPADWWLRMLGMFFGLAIPAAFWTVARSTQRPPIFSLVLFGLNSLFIIYGDSIRGYGLGTALIVGTLAAMWSFLKTPNWSRAAILALAATLSVQALYQNAILFFAICLGSFVVCARRKDFSGAMKILSAGIIAALSLLPYHASLTALPTATIELRHGFSPFIAKLNFGMATAYPFEFYTNVWLLLVGVAVGLTLLSFRNKPAVKKNADDDLQLFAGASLLAVAICFLSFLICAGVMVRSWYFIPPLALIAICFDLGIVPATLPRLMRVTLLSFLAGTFLVGVPTASGTLRGHFSNADQLAARLRASANPQDYIIVTPWFCGISFDHYFSGTTEWTTLPPITDHSIHRYDLVLKEMSDTNSLAPVLKKISATLQSGHRVWVVGNLPPMEDNAAEPMSLPPPPLEGYGYSDLPYLTSWAMRTEYFLNHHTTRFGSLPVTPAGTINFQENLQLFMAEGWRE